MIQTKKKKNGNSSSTKSVAFVLLWLKFGSVTALSLKHKNCLHTKINSKIHFSVTPLVLEQRALIQPLLHGCQIVPATSS